MRQWAQKGMEVKSLWILLRGKFGLWRSRRIGASGLIARKLLLILSHPRDNYIYTYENHQSHQHHLNHSLCLPNQT